MANGTTAGDDAVDVTSTRKVPVCMTNRLRDRLDLETRCELRRVLAIPYDTVDEFAGTHRLLRHACLGRVCGLLVDVEPIDLARNRR